MFSDPETGNVLVVSDDRDRGDRLARWIAQVGERPVALSGTEKFLIDVDDEEIVDLVVTDLDTSDPAGLALLRRLVSGDLLRVVPQIHLFRDAVLRETLVTQFPALVYGSLPAEPVVVPIFRPGCDSLPRPAGSDASWPAPRYAIS